MHILIVADHAWVNGGQSKVAIESAVGLAKRGHRVTYFAAVGPADERLKHAGVTVVCLGQHDLNSAPSALRFLPQYIWNRAAAKRLSSLIADMDSGDSVVHVHAFAKAVSPSIGPVLARSPVPVIYTMHEFFLVCPNGGFYDYPKSELCLRKPMSASCIACNCDSRSYAHKIMRVGRQVLINNGGLHKAFRHVVMISDLQQQVSQPFMPKDVTYYRVSNPIEASDRGPKTSAGKGFLFVGRVSREKGIEHFCEAAKLAGVQALIAGDGPLLEELKARYPDAQFLGWQTREQVSHLLRDARALVFPSVWYEGQPLTIYESLAAGTPVVVSDACAGREAVRHGHNGLWFHSADAASLAEAIAQFKDEKFAAAASQAAYDTYWSAPLSRERHVDAIEKIYSNLLKKTEGSAPLPEKGRIAEPAE